MKNSRLAQKQFPVSCDKAGRGSLGALYAECKKSVTSCSKP
jgi:hypothetical protein